MSVEQEPVFAPGPPALPVVGHLPAFLRNKLGFLSKCAAQYGDVVTLRIGEPTLLLTSPADIRHVLVSNASNYDKTRRLTSARGKRLSGRGLHTSFGAEHLRQRRLLQPTFHQRVVETFSDVMLDRIDRLAGTWTDGVKLDIASEMESLALSIILGALFGRDFEDQDDSIANAITVRRKYIEYIYGSLAPFPEYLPTRIVRDYRRAMRKIDETMQREIQLRRADPSKSHDFTSMFMNATYRDGTKMNNRQVRDEMLTMTSTGYETIGDALSWTIYLLTKHPEVESRLFQELNEVLGEQRPCVEDVPNLRYTRMVLDEAMRLYPPTWIFVRMALDKDVLPSGFAVLPGAKLYLCQYLMHRHPDYFPDPERFDPERFCESACANRPKFAYFPFGGGPRKCIGEAFAIQEAVLVLASIFQRFRFVLEPGQSIVPRPTITLRPKNGIQVRVRQRLGPVRIPPLLDDW